jgi:nucleotide-binding universal stress UspA family protein
MDAGPGQVVAGCDGGTDAAAALAWAIDEARRSRRPLRVVVAMSAMDPLLDSGFHQRTEQAAAEWRADAERVVAAAHLGDASVEVRCGPAVAVLLRSVGPGDLLVVGSQGHSPIVETIGGSVSQHLTRHARCPVVVVRPAARPDARWVVVGLDGSPESLAALRYACAQARLTGADVTALHAHRSWWSRAASRDRLAVMLSDWVRPCRAEYADVRISEELVEGTASDLLVDLSRGASLLALGHRGRDAFADLLLGSTTQEVLHRALCPVAVVR